MTKNNYCNSLIVYGSWAPGGKNHFLVEDLPGAWKKGVILAGHGSKGDDLHPGEAVKIEAWIIEFADCTAPLFSEEWEKQKVLLYERWTALDTKMGMHLVRTAHSWWPKKAKWWHKEIKPIRGENGQQVVNMYVPIENFQYLKNLNDSPSPEDEDDIKKLWLQQCSGEKNYDTCQFISLIKDCTLQECKEMFSKLPNIDLFLDKLSNLYQDMAYNTGYLLKQTDDEFYLYVTPRPEQKINSTQASSLVKREINQRCLLLEGQGLHKEADLLKNVTITIGEPPKATSSTKHTEDAYEMATEIIQDATYTLNEDWQYYLLEACYGITANYEVRDYLMGDFYGIDYDFSSNYKLWKGGWHYSIHENTCYLFQE
ncbi:hypothetical protein [Aquimarina brevivitae]|uniref:Uncharacterized protein n=1 Tax=Aquimarina brevivitae TaxID=323412 RepID=A0A4Q7P175_9FLAO|nr:hypothetical protein [Aquimarina brevivitae]RZS93573.1 hypothetical protein EV197_2153 [Aquimarina brevivitae]